MRSPGRSSGEWLPSRWKRISRAPWSCWTRSCRKRRSHRRPHWQAAQRRSRHNGAMNEATTQLVKVRPAGADDVEALAAIYEDSAEHHQRLDPSLYTTPDRAEVVERYRQKLPTAEDAEILVADIAGEVVGWVEIKLK